MAFPSQRDDLHGNEVDERGKDEKKKKWRMRQLGWKRWGRTTFRLMRPKDDEWKMKERCYEKAQELATLLLLAGVSGWNVLMDCRLDLIFRDPSVGMKR